MLVSACGAQLSAAPQHGAGADQANLTCQRRQPTHLDQCAHEGAHRGHPPIDPKPSPCPQEGCRRSHSARPSRWSSGLQHKMLINRCEAAEHAPATNALPSLQQPFLAVAQCLSTWGCARTWPVQWRTLLVGINRRVQADVVAGVQRNLVALLPQLLHQAAVRLGVIADGEPAGASGSSAI